MCGGSSTPLQKMFFLRSIARRYEDIIIDAGGRDSVELRVSLVVVEKAYIPAQASQFDIWTLDHLDELVATAQEFNPALRGFVVITRASPNPLVSEAEGARTILADYVHLTVAQTIIYDRIAYRRSGREGLTVSELSPPDRKATAEIALLYKEVFDGA
jgi:chromosome partitioning protein